MTKVSLVVFGLLLTVLGARAQEPVLLWHPGAGGSTKKATPIMAEFADYLEKSAGLSPTGLEIIYAPDDKSGRALFAEKSPVVCIVSLPVYLKYRELYSWVPILEAHRISSSAGRYVTVVRREKGSLPEPDAIVPKPLPAGTQIYGTGLWDPRFATRFMVAGAESSQVHASRKVASALRKLNRAGTAAVLSEKDYNGIRSMGTIADLQAVGLSQPWPGNLVVVREGVETPPWIAALRGIGADDSARDLRETLDLREFVPVDLEVIRRAEELYE